MVKRSLIVINSTSVTSLTNTPILVCRMVEAIPNDDRSINLASAVALGKQPLSSQHRNWRLRKGHKSI